LGFFSYASQLAYFSFFLEESVLHEVEKASYHLENSEKDVRDLMAWSGKPKTLNNDPTNPHSTFVYCPRISKNKLQKKGKTGLKTQKRI
jgi:hypothetical protein